MTDRLETLAQERNALSSEIALHRVELALAAQRMRRPLQSVDRIRENVRFVRTHYSLLLVPVVLLAVMNPRRTLKLLLGALSTWRAVQLTLEEHRHAARPDR
jgi:hypothetical protein